MKFEIGDIVLSDKRVLIEVSNVYSKDKQIIGKIIRCDIKKKEGLLFTFDTYTCKLVWKKQPQTSLMCRLFGHEMKAPFKNHRPINRCVRCGWKNHNYEREGYYSR